MEAIFKFIYEFQNENLYALLNSQFFSTILGALGGAFAGAFAAHKIALNTKKREEIEKEIRAVNVAISSAFLICNSILSLKNQHLEQLYKGYMGGRKVFENALKSTPDVALQFDMDLRTLDMPHIPIELLEMNGYEKITLRGRPLALISTLSTSIDTMRSSLNRRNKVIENFKSLLPTISQKEKLDYYFGFPLTDGSVDQEYLDTTEGLYQYADDVIFFSSLLCEDLRKHGNKLRNIYKKLHGKKIDKISGFHFDTPQAKAIWPNQDNYKDWLKMFFEQEKKKSWYERIFATKKENPHG